MTVKVWSALHQALALTSEILGSELMAIRSQEDDAQETPDGATPSARAAPSRLNAKKKLPSGVRKGRRKAGNSSGGIHLRANKRLNW